MDEAVKEWFDARLPSTIYDLNNHVEDAMTTLKYSPMPGDPSGAAKNLVPETIAVLDD